MNFLFRNPHITVFAVFLLITLVATSPVFGQDAAAGERLAQEHRCYACHDMRVALIGPPYQAIAARHAANRDVMETVLATKIILGGGGSWGLVPMVPNEHVPEADARIIARWILGLSAGG